MRKFGLIILLCAVASSAAAQKPKPIELGFKPERTYDFSGLDNVNRFNGNVIITIPLGLKYPVSSNLSYGLTLIHNSKLWDFAEVEDPSSHVFYTRAYPNLRSNAGPGWRVSMGRLFEGDEPTAINPTGVWMYESPSGGEHGFTANAHDARVPVDENATVQFTTDGSNLRMVKEANGWRRIEFPNGEKHWFVFENDAWRLKQIADQFDNLVTISYLYDSIYRVTRWTIADAWRSHTVEFTSKADLGDSADRGMTISRITMRGVADANGAQRDAVFDFLYTNITVPFPCHHDPGAPISDWPPGTTKILPMLTGLNMPDGTTYAFDYHTTTTSCEQGLIKQLTLPTGGTMAYTYGEYRLYAGGCEPSGSWNLTPGVKTRSVDGNVWTYFVTRGKEVMPNHPPTNPHCPEEVAGLLTPIQPVSRWVRSSVLSPNVSGNRTRSDVYFGAWPVPSPAPDPDPTLSADVFRLAPTPAWPGETEAAKAPPATGWEDSPDISAEVGPGIGRWLEKQVWTGCSAAGDCSGGLLRSTYVRAGKPPRDPQLASYENMLGPWTPLAERVVFEDDSGCGGKCWSESVKSDFDRLGRPREETTSSNFPDSVSASTKTTWKVWTTSELMDDDTRWSLGPYTAQTRTVGTKSSKSTFCFNALGQLLRQRMLAAMTEGPTDLISEFTYVTNGDVVTESTHGGDGASLSTNSDLCAVSLGTPRYLNRYTWAHGVFAKAEYLDPANPSGPALLVTQDFDVSSHTGSVTKSRDPAGVATDYVYDVVGRVKGVRPAGRAWAEYDYALTSTPPSVTARQCPNGQTSCTSTSLTESAFYFDALGRVAQERSRIPDAKWAATWLTFDAEGRKKTASVPVEVTSGASGSMPAGTAMTTWNYDGLGRVTSQTLPDASSTTFSYTGNRVKNRTSSIWTGANTSVTVREDYDHLGRLVSVTEPSGATSAANRNGANVATRYAYDQSDRLVEVAMNHGAAPVQRRLFDYDGRGFLRWESQPESGLTSYLYDARGHLTTKLQGAAQSQFDLRYFYDAAERVLRLEARNPLYGAQNEPMYRPMKTFEYSSANELVEGVWDLSKGKLKSASRYNYSRARPTDPPPIYLITDLYQYRDLPGRKTGRITTIDEITDEVRSVRTFTTKAKYNELDLLVSQEYPSCESCGVPPGDWDRDKMTRTYDAGRLTSIMPEPSQLQSGRFVPSITYWPNGLRKDLQHSNGTVDTQTVGVMPRPSSISFSTGGPCVRPSITQQFLNRSTGGPQQPITLFVNATGTAPLFYKWFVAEPSGNFVEIAGEVSETLPVAPMTSTSYRVTVTNPCGEVSATADVGVEECAMPKTGILEALRQPDNSWLLKASPMVSASPSFEWSSGGVSLGDEPTLPLAVVSQTTTYSFTAADLCGSATATVTITVPLSMTTTDLVAQATHDRTKIMVTWPDADGATEYRVFRRGSDGSSTEWLRADPWLEDTTAQPAVVYAYAASVSQGGTSNWSNSDLATRGTYIEAAAQAPISVEPSDEMLRAVNAVRALANWPPVTWETILSPSDPIVETGKSVVARQLLAARARMTEALQAIGVPVKEYIDHDIVGGMVKAAHINEVQQRVQ